MADWAWVTKLNHSHVIKETFVDQELFARFRKCAVEVLSVPEDKVRFRASVTAQQRDALCAQLALRRAVIFPVSGSRGAKL